MGPFLILHGHHSAPFHRWLSFLLWVICPFPFLVLTYYSFILLDNSGLQAIIRSLVWSGEKAGFKNSPCEKLYDSSTEALSGVFQQSQEAGFLFQRLTSFWILVPSKYCQLLLTKWSRPNFWTIKTAWKMVYSWQEKSLSHTVSFRVRITGTASFLFLQCA